MKTPAPELALALLLAAPTAADPVVYRVVSEESSFAVHVGKAGLFSAFGGHEHLIEVREYGGTVRWDAEVPESSDFVLEVKAASLTVADEDVSDDDRARIQADMETQALAAEDHPTILFESEDVELVRSENGVYALKVKGSLELRGVSAPLEIPLTLTASDGRLTARGELKLSSKTWGVPQISAVGGTIKTDDELALTFAIVATRE